MLVTCHPPFTFASSLESEHYKMIQDHRESIYWATINSLHSKAPCSGELMHLLSLMFQYEVSLRPSLSEIRSHAWVCKPYPSTEELRVEFEVRQQKTLEKKEAEAIKKLEARKKMKASPKKGPHHVTRAFEEKEEISPKPETKLEERVEDISSLLPSYLISAENSAYIEQSLNIFLSTIGMKCRTDTTKYKLTASSSSLQLCVRIFLYGEVLHLITVKRVQGDVVQFFDLYKHLKKFVEDSLQYRIVRTPHFLQSVSYTHLTLPTILLVQISVVAVSLKKKKMNTSV
eukprot:TRINITY_DN6023_c0_g1_i1.p1 TRINITY_DN6023_c0_g1~~TRINITY_DN6023_c0_g1_i1.p1  ORF type:complete len:287 (-),score=41.86 TRINITY_DN6023_c0_g1_i1:70-930(-)